ncbi:MAG: beta-ketoacyl-ACP synthase II [Verrucomicrobiia bacterium]
MGSLSDSRRVVLTGLGVVTPLGNTIERLWSNVLNGQCGIGRITAFDSSAYPCQIAAEVAPFDLAPAFPSAKEVRRADRFAQFGVYAGWGALLDSGLDLNRVDREQMGVYIGTGKGALLTLEEQHRVLLSEGPRALSPDLVPRLMLNTASALFSMYHGFGGPSLAHCSACATANHAIGEAWRAIKMGDAKVIFAGGTEASIGVLGVGGFCAMRALSTRNNDPKRASRPFDRGRDGFVMGEGAGVVVLEELAHARKRGARIYCEVLGCGNTADAASLTAPAPGGEGAARCMRMALRSSKLNPADVSYVNAHGTSTPQGDASETNAIRSVFGAHASKLAVSSTKGATGHLLAAAGGVEMAICAKAIEQGIVPPTLNYETPDPECDLDYVPNVAREMPVRAVINNSFGFGGHNACVVAGQFSF